ncbi:hypothetical protein ACGFK1_07195 [Mycobacterium sp. NPDC048908]|uniref:hypothetical protein n=1 Tax=Mycobacterium sp. NPDC048908 TaxID=3364292 RepID=UPI00371B5C8D
MFADTDAVRAFGSANDAHASDLAAVASALASIPNAATGAMLGPVGARFLAALTEATIEASRAVTELADRMAAGSRTAHDAAIAYDSTDARAGTRLSGVY